MNKNQYFYSLDLFRGFCGYGVAICHLNAFVYGLAVYINIYEHIT